jgi:hypothetical protein
MEKRGLHELLGRESMWLLSSCNYLNIPWGCFGVVLPLVHPLLIGSLVLLPRHSLLQVSVLLG